MRKSILKSITLFVSKSSILVGGQAVIEGVMMRVPGAYSTAVRDSQGEIHTNRHDFESITDRKPHLKKPILRGAISLFEAMKMGFQTLQWSADIAMPDEEKPHPIVDILMTIFSVLLAISLFFAAPIGLTTWLFDNDQDAFIFNIISGALRIFFFLIYLIVISLLSDVRRLFQYHGAEHKVVYNFESGENISIKNAQLFATQHPRCGTSFMFIVLLSAIFVFAIVDTITMYFIGEISIATRLLTHLPLIPLVSGFGYEIIKITSKSNSVFFYFLKKPGIYLQNITTKQPDDNMVEVSIAAIKDAFGDKYEEFRGQQFTAEAIG